MNNQKHDKLRTLFSCLEIITPIMIIITTILQLLTFNMVIHSILCSIILILLVITIILDILFKEYFKMFTIDAVWLLIWATNLILSIYTYSNINF